MSTDVMQTDVTEPEIESQSRKLEAAPAREVLKWAAQEYGRGVALVTSFQAEGSVLIDMAVDAGLDLRVVTIDTGRLPEENLELIEEYRKRYGLDVEIFFPRSERVESLVRRGGPNLFYDSPMGRIECCYVRKVEPLDRALADSRAWITGLRREQSTSRAGVAKVGPDPKRGALVKINPLADWTSQQVWDYIRQRGLPYNRLYDQGYHSIGCSPCTRPVAPGEDPRAGRWWWEDGANLSECGLHKAPGLGGVS